MNSYYVKKNYRLQTRVILFKIHSENPLFRDLFSCCSLSLCCLFWSFLCLSMIVISVPISASSKKMDWFSFLGREYDMPSWSQECIPATTSWWGWYCLLSQRCQSQKILRGSKTELPCWLKCFNFIYMYNDFIYA